MPKYVEYVSDENSEDEIQIVPFVKPAPPLIDLIDDEEEKNAESPKKGAKKKSKKKSSRTDNAETELSSPVPKPSVVPGSSDGDAVNSARAEKTGKNDGPTLRSKNAASPSKATSASKSAEDSTQHNSDSAAQSPSQITISNSILESVGNCDLMSPPVVTPEGGGNSASKGKGRAAPRRPRPLSHSSATKKTAAEITSFLNTLGIPVEVRDLTPITPVRPRQRVSKVKRKSLEVPLSDAALPPGNSLPGSSVSTGQAAVAEPRSQEEVVLHQEEVEDRAEGFVQVTQETNSPTKRKSKPSKKKTAEKSPFKSTELPASANARESTLRTNLISNLVFPGGLSLTTEDSSTSATTIPVEDETTNESSKKRKRKNSRNLSDDQPPSSSEVRNDDDALTSNENQEVEDSSTKTTKKKRNRRSSPSDSEADEASHKEKTKSKTGSKKKAKSDEIPSQETVASDEQGRKTSCKSPTKKKSKSTVEVINVSPIMSVIDTESSVGQSTDPNTVEEQSEIQIISANNESNQREQAREKILQEKIDCQNMPPPPRPKSNPNIRKKAPYYTNHSGFPSGWTDAMKTFYGTFKGVKFDENEVQKKQSNKLSLWRAPEDHRRTRKEFSRKRCVNCHQFGHIKFNCPEKYKPPRCTMCGGVGHTVDDVGRKACPSSCCLNCGTLRERFSSGCSRCTYRKQQPRCTLCGVSGHDNFSCPDIWRRYHSITTPIPDSVNPEECTTSEQSTEYKRRHESYCSNCAAKGHNYYHCQRPRYKNNPYHRNKPFVVQEFDFATIHSRIQQLSMSEDASTAIIDDNNSSQNESVSTNEYSTQIPSTSRTQYSAALPSASFARKESIPSTSTSSSTSSSSSKESAPSTSTSLRRELAHFAPTASSSSRMESTPSTSSSSRNEPAPFASLSSRKESWPSTSSSSRTENLTVKVLNKDYASANVSSDNKDVSPGAAKRTVVVDLTHRGDNKSKNESIRVQFQNDSLKTSFESNIGNNVISPLGPLGCVNFPECTNKITGTYLCQHFAVNPFQQSVLLKAKQDNLLREIEERKCVSICVLTSVLQVHIVGRNWKEAENELLDLLFIRGKEEQEISMKANDEAKLQSLNKSTEQSVSPNTHRTTVVNEDGTNISVRIVENVLLNKPPLLVPEIPSVMPIRAIPSMDVDERFASAQDLIQNIPIIHPDGPFAPGTYVPYSLLSPSMVVPVPSLATVPVQFLNVLPSGKPPNSAATNEKSAVINYLRVEPENKNITSKEKLTVSTDEPRTSSSTSRKASTASSAKNSSASVVEKPKKEPAPVPVVQTERDLSNDDVVTIADSDDEIMIIEEIIENPSKKKLIQPKQEIMEPGLNVVLLPSEWQIVFDESLKKDGILQKLAHIYQVTIFVSNESNSCTIHGGFLFAREQARKQVTLWLGCQAAKKAYIIPAGKFVPNPLAIPTDNPSSSGSLQSPPPSSSSVQMADPTKAAGSSDTSDRMKNVRGRSSLQSKENSRFKRKRDEQRYNPRPNVQNLSRSGSRQRNYDSSDRGSRGSSNSPTKRGRLANRIGFRGGNGARRSQTDRGQHSSRPNSSATPNKRFRYFDK